MLNNERDILEEIKKDQYMMGVLQAANSINLPDWWVCAGFVRSKIWDVLHGFNESTPTDDVDVVYFDPNVLDEEIEKKFEQKLKDIMPTVPWSVKNEARMHHVNGLEPYLNTVDAISKFPETVTALGIKINEYGELILTSPHGLHDVLNMNVRPTPYFKESKERMDIYYQRLQKKNWKEKWYKVTYLVE